jgi:hypothetical protein
MIYCTDQSKEQRAKSKVAIPSSTFGLALCPLPFTLTQPEVV